MVEAITSSCHALWYFSFKEVKKESKEVKEVKSEPKEEPSHATRREKSSGNVANLVQRMSIIGIPTGGFQPHPPPAAKSKMQSVFLREMRGSSLFNNYLLLSWHEHKTHIYLKSSISDNTQYKMVKLSTLKSIYMLFAHLELDGSNTFWTYLGKYLDFYCILSFFIQLCNLQFKPDVSAFRLRQFQL